MAKKIVTRQFLLSVTVACLIGFLGGSDQPAHAETQDFVLNLSVYGQTVYSDLISQAELRVGEVINRQFSQNPNLSNIQVVVMGDRHGEIIPVLTTRVSRLQWQSNPQVNLWTKYYDASYALIQRHDVRKVEVLAAVPIQSTTPNVQSRAFQIDEAFDSGGLTGKAAQAYLSSLD